jgi:hypothetical protein
MEILAPIILIVILLSLLGVVHLYFLIVGERIQSMYFEGMMWSERISANHSRKLNELFILGIRQDPSVEAKRTEFDIKSAKAWNMTSKKYSDEFEYKIWEPVGSLYSKEEKEVLEWNWGSIEQEEEWANEIS